MINIFKEMPISVGVDVPDKSAVILTFDCGCNLRCFRCHYIQSREDMDKISLSTAKAVLKKTMSTGLIDCIVLTGGEVTLIPTLHRICIYLQDTYPDTEIIINTNGMNPSYVSGLLDLGITFHVDIKMSDQNFIARDRVIGFSMTPDDYLKRLMMTLHHIYKDKSDKHILRTVDYPVNEMTKRDNSALISYSKSIENMVNHLNSKYNKQLKWYLNDFYEFA